MTDEEHMFLELAELLCSTVATGNQAEVAPSETQSSASADPTGAAEHHGRDSVSFNMLLWSTDTYWLLSRSRSKHLIDL